MAIVLREHQERSVEALRAEIRRQMRERVEPSMILVSPTGSGKTAMAAYVTKSGEEKGSKVAFLCHRKELIDQTALTFDKAGVGYSFIASGYPNAPAQVRICSVGTLARRIDDYGRPDVVIWDECHHVGAASWAKIRQKWAGAVHIGLTATPARLDGKGLGHWFRTMVDGPTVAELIAAGQLSTYDAYSPSSPNLSSVHKRGGEFVTSELESVLDTGEIIGGIVSHWVRLAKGRKTVVFACSVQHSLDLVLAFNEAGIPAKHIDSKTPKPERRRILQQFALGHVHVLSNVELFGEGFDLAANSGMDVNVEAVILARPTASLGLHLQQVGRCLRPKPEPAIILDHAGNLLRHGLPDEERHWTLEDQTVEQSEAAGPKMCPRCFGVIARHLRECRLCGFVFPKPEGRKVEEVDGELEQIVSGTEMAEQLRLRFTGPGLRASGRARASQSLPPGISRPPRALGT